jgi:hypothetical protein
VSSDRWGAGRALAHGVCLGVLSWSWLIREGAADDTDLPGNPVALASRYSDHDPGSPWTWSLYLDARPSEAQRAGTWFNYRDLCGYGSTFDHAG